MWIFACGIHSFGLLLMIISILFFLGDWQFRVVGRYLEIREDAMLIPSGFLHRRVVLIPYVMIDWVKDDRHFFIIRAKPPMGSISRMNFRTADYDAIREFLRPLAAKNMEQRLKEIMESPAIDRRQINHAEKEATDEPAMVTIEIPDRDEFIAYWNEDQIFRWRKLLPYVLYVGGLAVYALLVHLIDSARHLMPMSLALGLVYVFLVPYVAVKAYRKKYSRFIRCLRCGDWFGLDLSGAYDGPNPKWRIVAQTGHCTECGAKVLT